jgi:hypothetical protein
VGFHKTLICERVAHSTIQTVLTICARSTGRDSIETVVSRLYDAGGFHSGVIAITTPVERSRRGGSSATNPLRVDLTTNLKSEGTAETDVTEPGMAEQLETGLGIGLMEVPEPRDREFVERARRLIVMADLDARAVAAELLKKPPVTAH